MSRPHAVRPDSVEPARSRPGSDPGQTTIRLEGPRRALQGVALFVAFSALALVLYAPALRGTFLSDDLHYVSRNPFVQSLGLDNLVEIWNPRGVLPIVVENYAPVHLTLHALVWSVCDGNVVGHHVVNVLLHALTATLLALLFCRAGISVWASIAGAAVFLVHPANVEAVAWISQLKSPASLALALAALLLHPRRPACAVLSFLAALFAKPTVAFALPVVVGMRLIESTLVVGPRSEAPADRSRAWLWLGGWVLALLLFGVVEMAAFSGAAGHLAPLHPDPVVTARTIVAFVARYLAMAAAGVGLSAFHEPARALSLLDAWWLAGFALLALGMARTVSGLRRVWPALRGRVLASASIRMRATEILFLGWAIAAFAPVAQIFPFQFPMADRYLYSLLPGLIGAVLCALAPCLGKGGRRGARLAVAAAAVALVLGFSAQTFGRAAIWASPERVMRDAARHYPDGISAHQLRARSAAERGDREGALTSLRAAFERGFDSYEAILSDAALAPMREDPGFREIVRDMAALAIVRSSRGAEPSPVDLLARSRAHAVRDEWQDAVRDLEQLVAMHGPLGEIASRELASARARLRTAE